MMIVTKGDVGRIMAIYVEGEASKGINGVPIRITEVNEAYVKGYLQSLVLADENTAEGMKLENLKGLGFGKDCGSAFNGNLSGTYQVLAEATVDAETVRIGQDKISFICSPKVSNARRNGMPKLGEDVSKDILNTSYPKPAWQEKVADRVNYLL